MIGKTETLVKRSLMTLRMNNRMHYSSKGEDFGEERWMLDCRELRDKCKRYTVAEFKSKK